jgi:uncharacterized protein YkwD
MVSAAPRTFRRAAAVAATVLLASTGLAVSPVAATRAQPSPVPTVGAESLPTAVTNQQRMAYYVNNYRTTRGIPALRYNSALQLAAQRHANDMARMNRLTHTGSNGSNAGQRITAAGFRWSTWAENIAVGYTTPWSAFVGWINSPPHRVNIVSRTMTHMGVGIASGYGRYWWCLVVARG